MAKLLPCPTPISAPILISGMQMLSKMKYEKGGPGPVQGAYED